MIDVKFNQTILNKIYTVPALVTMGEYFPYSTAYLNIKLQPDDGAYILSNKEIFMNTSRNFAYFQVLVNEKRRRKMKDVQRNIVFEIFGRGIDKIGFDGSIEFKPEFVDRNFQSVATDLAWVEEEGIGKLKLSLNNTASIFWSFGPSQAFLNPNYSTYDFIKEKSYPILGYPSETQSTLEDRISAFTNYLKLLDNSNWTNFQNQMKIFISSYIFHDQSFLSSGEYNLIDQTYTIPTLEYTAVIWIKNLYGDLNQLIWTGYTEEFQDHCILKLKLKKSFNHSLDSLALAYKIPSSRIQILNETTEDGSYITEFLFFSDYLAEISIWQVLKGVSRKELQNYLKDNFIYQLSVRKLKQYELGIPKINNISDEIESNKLIVSSYTDIKSFVCCVAELNPDRNFTLKNNEILNSKDRLGLMPSFSQCYQNLYENFEFAIPLDGFKDEGDYLITCIMCNYYPMNELCTDSNSSYNYVLNVFMGNSDDLASIIQALFLVIYIV